MSTCTKRLLSVLLAMVMVFGNLSPAAAAAADYGDIFDTAAAPADGDIFDPGTAEEPVAEAPAVYAAAAADHAELPKAPMQASVTVDSQENEGDNSYGDGPAQWAFDGDVAKPWHSKYTGGDAATPHWIAWDLGTEGQVFEVSKLHYHMKNNGSGNGLWAKVTVQAFNGDVETLNEDIDVPSGDCDLVFSKTVTATRMKVTVKQSTENYSCVGELDVYGKLIAGEPTPPPKEVGPVALAEGKEYKQIPQTEIQNPTAKSQHDNAANPHSGDGPAAWAFDGLNNSAWHCNYSGGLPQWIRWELGGTRTVGQIGYIRNDNGGKNEGNGRWKDIEVIGILPDGSEKVLTSGLIKVDRMNGDGTEVMIGFEPTAVTALKVNITDSYNKNGKFAQAGEIKTYEVVDKVAPPPPVTHDYKIVVTPEALTLNEGETGTVTARAMDGDQELTDVIPVWQAAAGDVVAVEETAGNEVSIQAIGPGNRWVRVIANMPDGAQYNNGVDVTVNAVETMSTIAINGVDYQATSLENAVTQAKVNEVTSIEFKTGFVKGADFDYLKTISRIASTLTKFRIEDAVELRGLSENAIPSMAFDMNGMNGVALTHVYLGTNVKKLDYQAFPACKELVSFEAPGLETFHTISGTCLGKLYALETLSLPMVKDFNISRTTITGFARGPYSLSRVARLYLPSAEVLSASMFSTDFYPSEIHLGAKVPSLYPSASRELDIPLDYPDMNLYVPDEAIAAYKASPLYNEATGKWAGLVLVEPEVPVPQCEVQLTETTLNMTRGDSNHQLFAKFLVDGVEVPDASITWTVNSQNVAISPSSGTRIYVDAVAPCEGAVITASVTHEGQTYTADCVVNVANAYEVTFTDNHTNYIKYVAPDTALGDDLQADQPSTATKKFLGWFNGETKATRDYVVTGDITFEARYEILNTTEVVAADGTVTGYETFNAAIKEAPDGSTVRLIMDVYQGVAPEPLYENHITNNLTLDLNGHKLVGDEPQFNWGSETTPIYVDVGAALTIRDSKGGGQIIAYESTEYGASSKGSHPAIWNKGTLTVESGTIISVKSVDNRGVTANTIINHGTLNINGGELYGFVANSVDAGSKGCVVFAATSTARTVINGGKLAGAKLNTEDPSQSLAIDSGRDAQVAINGGQLYGTQKDVLSKYTSCVKGGYFAHNFVDANDPALLINGYEAQRGNLVDGQWTADEAGTLYRVAKPAEMVTVTFQGEGVTTTTRQVEKGQKLGTLPEDPVKDGFKFLGWFNGDEKITADTTVNNAFTATARFEAVVISKFNINKQVYEAASLEAAVALANAETVTNITAMSGQFTQADLDYFKTIPQIAETLGSFAINNGVQVPDFANNTFPAKAFDLGGASFTALKSIQLGNTVTGIGSGAFANCPNVESFRASGLVTVDTADGPIFSDVTAMKSLTLPAMHDFSLNSSAISGFAAGPAAEDTEAVLWIQYVDRIRADILSPEFYPSEIHMGNKVPVLYPEGSTTMNVIDGREIRLIVGDSAEQAFKESPLYDQATGKWAGLKLVEHVTGWFDMQWSENELPLPISFEKNEKIPAEFLSSPHDPDPGYEFAGWFLLNTHVKLTPDYVTAEHFDVKPLYVKTGSPSVTYHVDGKYDEVYYFDQGQTVGANMPADPVAPEGQIFKGWFNGDTQITEATEVTQSITAAAKFEAEAVEAVLTAKVNGTQYGGADLAAIIAAAGGNNTVTTLEMISGTVTQADMDQFKLLANMTDLTMNLDGDLTVLNKAGEPTTVLGGNDAHVVFAYAGPNSSRAKLAHLTLQGFTALNQNGIKQYYDSNHSGYTRDSGLISIDLPDVVTIGNLGLTGHEWLETLNVPKLETIEGSGLKGNTSLNNLELPAIKTIGYMGLQHNNSLTNIHMGPNVTRLDQIGLGQTDGNGKKTLHLVIDALNPPTLNDPYSGKSPCFKGANPGSTVTVPAEALSKYLNNADISKFVSNNQWGVLNGGKLPVIAEGYSLITYTVPQQTWDTKFAYVADGTAVTEAQIPTAKKNGMTFTEWNTKRGGDGETFAAGKIINGNLEVFAQFGTSEFTVTFKADDTVVETRKVNGGSALGDLPAAPDKEGYTFTGWYDESNIPVATQTTVGKDMTIVAKYKVKTYTVKFMNEGTLVNERTVEHGQTLGTVPEDPSAGTRTFKGWFSGEIQAEAGTVITSNMTFQAAYGPEAMTGRDVNFYAYVDGAPKLVENRKDLTVYKIGSRQGISAALLEDVYGAYGFTADQLTDGSKLFANTTRDGGTIWADAPAEVVEGMGYALTVNQDSVTEIDVYYLPKQSVTGSSAKDNAETMAAETFYTITNDQNSDKAYVLNGEPIARKLPAEPTKEGFTFVEWTVNDQAVNAGTVVNAPMALVAKWRTNGPEELANRNVKFYVFVDDQRVLASNPTDITTYWIENRQCITGADLEAAYGKYGFKADTLANSDGMFLHTDRNNTGIWNAGIMTVNGVSYAATINHKVDTPEGAKGNEIDVYYLPKTSGDVGNYNDVINAQTFYTVTNGDNVRYFLNGTEAVVKVPNEEGMKWIATGADDTVINGVKGETETTITIPNIAQPYTLSKAAAEAGYTVKHLQQNLAGEEYTLADTETLTGAVGAETAAAAKTYEGFTAQAVTQKTIAADGSTVIEIRYNRNTFTVTAVDGVESTNDVHENVRYGTAFGAVVPENPVRNGYTFQGWNTSEDGQGQAITAETVLIGELTVYAQWTAKGVCMIQETGEVYETVSAAVNAAVKGQHVVMLQDSTEDMVILRKGITLDLNGQTLTADYVASFKDNHLVDTTAHLGKLIVTSSIALDENNAQMAVFDVDGYRFGNMLMNQELETPDSNTMTVWMKPFFVDKDTTLPMFSNGAKDNQIGMGATLTWTREDGSTAVQTFVFSDSMVAQTYTKGTMKVIITGVEGLQNVQVRTMVISDTGIISYGDNLVK